jgi:transcriptional regulator
VLTEKEMDVLKLRRANLTQVEVAAKLGISQAAVSSFEQNAVRKMEDAKRTVEIAKKLGIRPV